MTLGKASREHSQELSLTILDGVAKKFLPDELDASRRSQTHSHKPLPPMSSTEASRRSSLCSCEYVSSFCSCYARPFAWYFSDSPGFVQAAARKMFDSGEHFLAKEGKSTIDALPVPVSGPLPIKDVWSPATVNAASRPGQRGSRLAVSSNNA